MQPIAVFESKRIVLGVTGSIAAYKAVDLASKLTQAGALVDIIMTESAARFVAPITFRSVTGRQVHADLWRVEEHIAHVGLGETADLLLIAPATANTLAKMAHGLADNLLTVTALAATCPLVVAPAMDGSMYQHPATQEAVERLMERGAYILGPEKGRMASGLAGLGRMMEPPAILSHLRPIVGRNGSLAGRRVVVTAGPTREALDPVRFISNRSTGKQGLSVAQAALDAGAHVTLIKGPTCGEPPLGAKLIDVVTTAEMGEAVLAAVRDADILFMVAAVADFAPGRPRERKIKKTEEEWGQAIGLEVTLDILEAVKEQREKHGFPRVTVGFAAETHESFDYGREKLWRKGLDFIVINDVLAEGAGFEVETNVVTVLNRQGDVEEFPMLTKAEVAERLMQRVATAVAMG